MIAGVLYAIVLVSIMTWVQKAFVVDSRTVTLMVLSIAAADLGGHRH